MSALLSSVRRKLLGETWTIPLGVGAAILVGLLVRTLLPHAERTVGGFALTMVVIATLIRSLPIASRRSNNRHALTEPDQHSTTRTD